MSIWYRTRDVYSAIQYTGENIKEIESFTNNDAAVFQSNGFLIIRYYEYEDVPDVVAAIDSWIVKDEHGHLSSYSNEVFDRKFYPI